MRLPAAVAGIAVLALGASPAAAPGQSPSDALAAKVLADMQSVHFERVVDFANGGGRIAHVPNVDVAVIALDRQGRATAAADVLLSRDYPRGQIVPLDANWGTTAVRFTRWRQSSFDGSQGRGTDIVGGRSSAPLHFMAPYPASLFKIMVAYEVMRQVDRGRMHLGSRLRYAGSPASSLCAPGTSTVRRWIDSMLTWSSNQAACALITRLHRLGAIATLNGDLRGLGLGTLQVNGTRPSNGANWQDGQLNMTALDTARLFWLIDGGQGTLWHRPNGRAVTAGELKPSSRAFLKRELGQDPGQPYRHYVVAVLSNLGSNYGDPDWGRLNPCGTSLGLCRTERFAQLGRLIDDAMRAGRAARRPARGAGRTTGHVVAQPGWRPHPDPDGRP